MDGKLCVMFFAMMMSSLANAEDLDLGGLMGGGAASAQSSLLTSPCLPKLMPCHQFVGADPKPTDACCDPLKEIFSQETKCICDAFHTPSMLAAINVTKDDLLKLPKACGLDANEEVCKSLGSTPTASPGGNDAKPAESKDAAASGNSDSKYVAIGISYLSGYSMAALIVALFISA